jgi:hypothetical protein
MAIKEERKIDWLYVASLLWGGIGPVSLCLAIVFVAFYDSPLSGEEIGVVDQAQMLGVISFPITCIVASIGTRFLKGRHRNMAFIVSFLPVIPVLLLFALYVFWI